VISAALEQLQAGEPSPAATASQLTVALPGIPTSGSLPNTFLSNPRLIYESHSGWRGLLHGENERWRKDGIPADTLPIESEAYRLRFLKAFNDLPQGAAFWNDRRSRIHSARSRLEKGAQQRYIISRSAIERYIRTGVPNWDEPEASVEDWIDDPEDRVQTIQNLVQFLRTFQGYELGLLDSEASDTFWWGVYSDAYSDKSAILEVLTGAPKSAGYFLVQDVGAVAQYRADFDRQWKKLPKEATHKRDVIAWLMALLAAAPST
jgi:hypothetical protein